MGIVMKSSAILLAVLSIFTVVTSGNFITDSVWKAFKSEYNKNYPCERQELEAYGSFLLNKRDVEIQNLKYAMNQSSYFCGLNENSDIDGTTWIKVTSGFKLALLPVNSTSSCFLGETAHIRSKRAAAPATVDYHKSGLTMPVKNQGTCGSCYSFAVAASVEAQVIKRLGNRIDLSSQQILDCSSNTRYGNHGCEGGGIGKSFDYVKDNGGLTSLEKYPYSEGVGSCKAINPIKSSSSHRRYVEYSLETIKALLASQGPLVSSIYAHKELSAYKGGIYTSPLCRNTQMDQLNHSVLIVGYGTENGKNYWKLKNSWGTSWGRDGYLYIDQNMNCGLTLDVYQSPG